MDQREKVEAVRKTASEIDGRVESKYSGRGMFGKTCYGIVCDDRIQCIETAAANGLKGAKVDQLGKGYIVYWPDISGF